MVRSVAVRQGCDNAEALCVRCSFCVLILRGHTQCSSTVSQGQNDGLPAEPCRADPPAHAGPGPGGAPERQLGAGHAAGAEAAAQVGLLVDVDGTE